MLVNLCQTEVSPDIGVYPDIGVHPEISGYTPKSLHTDIGDYPEV
jgi:hypothetical protein